MISFSSTRKVFSVRETIFDTTRCSQTFTKVAKELNSGGLICTVLMDLLKAYDCLLYDLLIEKLEAYGLDNDSLNFLLDYLSFRK